MEQPQRPWNPEQSVSFFKYPYNTKSAQKLRRTWGKVKMLGEERKEHVSSNLRSHSCPLSVEGYVSSKTTLVLSLRSPRSYASHFILGK